MSIDEAYGLYDATGLAGLVVSNEVKVAELVEVAITRIEEQNPRLNAVVLPAFADARDRVVAGVPQGPLHGVPYLVKDLNTNVAGLLSTNGSRALRDVVDHAIRVLERIEGFRALLTNILTVNAALVGQRQNEVMTELTQAGYDQNEQVKRISSWAAIFFAPTLVASVYGMNFDVMPETHWTLGYPFALLLMVLFGTALYTAFKRRGWL